MTRAARPAVKIDVVVASGRWKHAEKATSLMRRAVRRAAAATPSTNGSELAIVLTDDSAIRQLNRDWRGIDAATNVLSFPAKNAGRKRSKHLYAGSKNLGEHLGDVVLAYETIAREARAEGKPFVHHLAHLAVHGFLHLAGHDHESTREAAVMERAERDILRQLAIPDPYRPPKQRRAKRSHKS
jgi:probable rRNA maturation factor